MMNTVVVMRKATPVSAFLIFLIILSLMDPVFQAEATPPPDPPWFKPLRMILSGLVIFTTCSVGLYAGIQVWKELTE
jgi:hypothetical protein